GVGDDPDLLPGKGGPAVRGGAVGAGAYPAAPPPVGGGGHVRDEAARHRGARGTGEQASTTEDTHDRPLSPSARGRRGRGPCPGRPPPGCPRAASPAARPRRGGPGRPPPSRPRCRRRSR